MNISELKNRKKALRLTTAQLALLAELPVSTVSKIMTGETKNPSYLTIEKIETAIIHEEIRRRILAYKIALSEYLASHKENDFDPLEFESYYRTKNNLSDVPIPFATPVDDSSTDGNLAKQSDMRVDISMLRELDNDRFIELINGRLIIGQAPSITHQLLVQNIGKVIDNYIATNHGKCRMFNVGVNVRLDRDDYTLVIPDIVVLCDDDKLGEDYIYGAPDLIIEVVSKSTRHIDYKDKMHKYMQAGTREYWIVDYERERVSVYIDGEPIMVYLYSTDDDIPVGIYDGRLTIKIRDLM